MSAMSNLFIEILEENPELMAIYDQACEDGDDAMLEYVFQQAQAIWMGRPITIH
jgi:hypothetical protein